MKKIIIAALALCLAVSLCVPCFALSSSEQLETIRAAGIMVGDAQGNMNLEKAVTRAEFTKMMVAASPYRDSVAPGAYSLFTDVTASHWASGYIKAAVEANWMIGYSDGSFRPSRTITLEEGCTALLRVLGYDASSLIGPYPDAQLLKAQSVGLRDGVNTVKGQALSRADCVPLFYNLLGATTAQGQVYGNTLGYTVKDGEVDYSSLVTKDTKGPFIAEGSGMNLPSLGTYQVYRDGKLSSASAVRTNDVYYYNTNSMMVWVYSEKASGTITAIAPNKAAPQSVTVAGVTYPIGSSSAAYALSAQGTFSEGDTVTLLLGMNGDVVRVLAPDSVQSDLQIGVVTGNTATTFEGVAYTDTKIVTADGVERSIRHTGGEHAIGELVSVTFTGSGNKISSLGTKSLSGTVSADGKSVGTYTFSDTVQILDANANGAYRRIYPSRLAGKSLPSSAVRYYTTDSQGKISTMILNDATGDLYTYGYLVSATTRTGNMSAMGQYSFYLNGTLQQLGGSTVYPVQVGGIAIGYKQGQLASVRQLASAACTAISGNKAVAGGKELKIAEDVQVLIKKQDLPGSDYMSVAFSDFDASKYTVTVYYDNFGCPAGGIVRLITATPK